MSEAMHGTVVLVTGAASGIGKATAQAFADAGASVVLADVNEQAVTELAARLPSALAVKCDVTDEQQVIAMVEQAVAKFGRLDAAFNDAGIINAHVPTDEVDDALWDRTLNINLKGMWYCMKHELKQMLKQGSGSIVNCSSIGGLSAAPGLSAYTASKHGVIGLTRTSALEYIKKGIRINVVCPGMIDTPMGDVLNAGNPGELLKMVEASPIGRFGKPEEIASAVLWLSSPAASFVVGAVIAVDGGVTAA